MDTAEERRAAHNASSRRSYAKYSCFYAPRLDQPKTTRHLNRRRAKETEAGTLEPLDGRQGARPIEIEVNSGQPHTQRSATLTEAMDQIIRLSARFGILTLGSPRRHADIIYREYQRSVTVHRPQGFRSLLDEAVLEMSSLEQSLLEQKRVILNSASSGNEMEKLHAVLDPVRMLVGWLEEIHFEAMISPVNLRAKYLRRELAFLKYD
ncbi:uncharacterized protein EV420DRAFT_1764293 [Desarmillaria tabescens]|uniref:Uncharacterized protein n=1 Tax=Armillaria tabescens TaxID=1929756 RepID=A0AA39KCK6_ARMTA|nr:uncharacterized protein EV420DRAFT_1764293 [Desarmillaria tabescens]KAK0458676.1 hypothetical protein EV420DRAFT_1764293 [Desarmillaria tabescens]